MRKSTDIFCSMPPVTEMITSSLRSRHGTGQLARCNHGCSSLLHGLDTQQTNNQYVPGTLDNQTFNKQAETF